jgi:hypothetical protein
MAAPASIFQFAEVEVSAEQKEAIKGSFRETGTSGWRIYKESKQILKCK